MKKSLFLSTALLAFLSQSSYATIALSTGAKQAGLAGGGVANPEDSTWVKLNPAGLVGMNGRLDYSFEYLRPHNEVDGSGPLANSQSIDDTGNLFFPHISYVRPIDERSAFGAMLFVNSGYSTEYSAARSAPGAGGGYDTRLDYSSFKLALSYAYRLDNGWQVGFGPNISYARVRTDMMTLAGTETTGDNEWDDSFGAGFQFAVYKKWDKLSFGSSFTSRQWFSTFDKYRDVVNHPLDMPNILQTGFAYDLTNDLTMTLDWQFLQWSEVEASNNDVLDGGFGWEDHNIYKLGFIWQATADLSLRTGYSYGTTPIQEDAIFVNAMAPIIIEHYVSLGASYEINDKWELNFGYIHGFEHTEQDSGEQLAAVSGTEVTAEVDIVNIGVSYSF